jgi:hypothetical protein
MGEALPQRFSGHVVGRMIRSEMTVGFQHAGENDLGVL